LEHDYAQQLMLVILSKVVRKCIEHVYNDIRWDLKLPQAFAIKLLTKTVAATRR
jgi:hypothetical protein